MNQQICEWKDEEEEEDESTDCSSRAEKTEHKQRKVEGDEDL